MFGERYCASRLLHDGTDADVWEALDQTTGKKVVVKVSSADPHVDQIETEMELLGQLNHPNVVHMLDIVEEPTRALVLEYAPGGALVHLVIESEGLAEDVVKNVMRSLLTGLSFMHGANIVNRDIKLDNMLVTTDKARFTGSEVVINDFGYAFLLPQGAKCNRYEIGSLAYSSPEMLFGVPYDEKIDMWAAGVVAYACLTGTFPYSDSSSSEIVKQEMLAGLPCMNGDADIDDKSPEAIDFLNGLFQLNGDDRMSAEEALRHPWLADQ